MKNRTEINELITNWIPEAVYSVKWLLTQGYSYSNLHIYKSSGWVQTLGSGALIKNGDKVHWQGTVWALQEQLKLPVHVGSKTAIEQAGSAVPYFRKPYFSLQNQTKLPTWFKTKWDAEIMFLPHLYLAIT